jgi:hypothetical protein
VRSLGNSPYLAHASAERLLLPLLPSIDSALTKWYPCLTKKDLANNYVPKRKRLDLFPFGHFLKDLAFFIARFIIHHLTMLLKSASSGLLAFSKRGVVQKIVPQAFMASSTQQASWGGLVAPASALKRRAYSSTTALRAGEMDSMETGTKKYMSLYPEGSTDGSK